MWPRVSRRHQAWLFTARSRALRISLRSRLRCGGYTNPPHLLIQYLNYQDRTKSLSLFRFTGNPRHSLSSAGARSLETLTQGTCRHLSLEHVQGRECHWRLSLSLSSSKESSRCASLFRQHSRHPPGPLGRGREGCDGQGGRAMEYIYLLNSCDWV